MVQLCETGGPFQTDRDDQSDCTVEKATQDQKWVDHCSVSLLGTNQNGGAVRITQTKQPGARQLALSAAMHPPCLSLCHKCHLQLQLLFCAKVLDGMSIMGASPCCLQTWDPNLEGCVGAS